MAAAYGLPAAVRKAVTLLMFLLPSLAGGAQAAAPVRLLVLGDSLTAGYGLPHEDGFQAQLAKALAAQGHGSQGPGSQGPGSQGPGSQGPGSQGGREVKIIDAAVSGDTSAGGRARLDWALGDGVDVAIVELGANDMLRGLDPAQMDTNLSAILDDFAARHIPVLLTGMYALPNLGADYDAAYKAVFARLGARKGVIFDPFFLEGVAEMPSLVQADGLHPNAAGVRKEVARLLPLVEQLLAQVRE